jgi:hypothetical protein
MSGGACDAPLITALETSAPCPISHAAASSPHQRVVKHGAPASEALVEVAAGSGQPLHQGDIARAGSVLQRHLTKTRLRSDIARRQHGPPVKHGGSNHLGELMGQRRMISAQFGNHLDHSLAGEVAILVRRERILLQVKQPEQRRYVVSHSRSGVLMKVQQPARRQALGPGEHRSMVRPRLDADIEPAEIFKAAERQITERAGPRFPRFFGGLLGQFLLVLDPAPEIAIVIAVWIEQFGERERVDVIAEADAEIVVQCPAEARAPERQQPFGIGPAQRDWISANTASVIGGCGSRIRRLSNRAMP